MLYSSRLNQCEVCKIVVKFCCVELTWGFVLIPDTTMHTCCAEQNTNISINGDDDYLPSETGNLTITYDITQAYEGNYWAQVCTHSCSLRSHFFWTPTWCFILEPILGFDYYYYYGKNSAKIVDWSHHVHVGDNYKWQPPGPIRPLEPKLGLARRRVHKSHARSSNNRSGYRCMLGWTSCSDIHE
jgi:hypothetical protein